MSSFVKKEIFLKKINSKYNFKFNNPIIILISTL